MNKRCRPFIGKDAPEPFIVRFVTVSQECEQAEARLGRSPELEKSLPSFALRASRIGQLIKEQGRNKGHRY